MSNGKLLNHFNKLELYFPLAKKEKQDTLSCCFVQGIYMKLYGYC